MIAKTRLRISFPVALYAWAFLACGCVQPLGPGFHFADRRIEIRVSGDSSARIQLRVADQLENTGDRPLRSLEVRLPEGPAFGAQNLRVVIGGAEVTTLRGSETDIRMLRAPFDPAWGKSEKREIVTQWDFMPDSPARGTIGASANGFFISDETALPLWQTPTGVFAKGESNPSKELLRVFTPMDFSVLAPGKPLKRGADGIESVRSFLIDPTKDFIPYIVAGRYQEKIIQKRGGQVQFWTFGPLDAQAADAAAVRVSSSMKAFADFFGPASKGTMSVRIVEAPAQLPVEFGGLDDPGSASFPQGILLDSRAYEQGIGSEKVMQLAEYELARTWFGWRVRPQSNAQILMGRGIGLFGMVIAAEGRGGDQRRRIVASLIDRYDQARAIAPDRRLMETPVGYSRAERISTGYRAALFFVALEDLCGHDNLGSAVRDIVKDLAGNETSYEDLRSATESTSGKDLADMFRLWLVQPGIPEDFRARYHATAGASLRN